MGKVRLYVSQDQYETFLKDLKRLLREEKSKIIIKESNVRGQSKTEIPKMLALVFENEAIISGAIGSITTLLVQHFYKGTRMKIGNNEIETNDKKLIEQFIRMCYEGEDNSVSQDD